MRSFALALALAGLFCLASPQLASADNGRVGVGVTLNWAGDLGYPDGSGYLSVGYRDRGDYHGRYYGHGRGYRHYRHDSYRHHGYYRHRPYYYSRPYYSRPYYYSRPHYYRPYRSYGCDDYYYGRPSISLRFRYRDYWH